MGPVQSPDITVAAPPSKSVTHRALLAAALATGRSEIRSPLIAGDTCTTIRALRTLGTPIRKDGECVFVDGGDGGFPVADPVTIDCGNSGTSYRLLVGASLLAGVPVTLTGSPRMLQRPIGPLVAALGELGAGIGYADRQGFPPLVTGGRLAGGQATLDATISSQYVSSILMAAPFAEAPVELELASPPSSAQYIDLTLSVMADFGVDAERRGYEYFRVEPSRYRSRRYRVEGDWSAASYFFAIAAACGGRTTITGLSPGSVQPDRRLLSLLEEMGCRVSTGESGTTVERTTGPLAGIDCDLSGSPDIAPTVAAVAAFAESPTSIRGIAQLRHKESDRVAAIAAMLEACGVATTITDESLTVIPSDVHHGTVDPHDDHRIAMASSVIGLAGRGVTIGDAGCVGKSFPAFWDVLKEIGLWQG